MNSDIFYDNSNAIALKKESKEQIKLLIALVAKNIEREKCKRCTYKRCPSCSCRKHCIRCGMTRKWC